MHDSRVELDTDEIFEFKSFLEILSERCRNIIEDYLKNGLQIQIKPDLSYVTDLDLALETSLRLMIQAKWPEHSIVGEEINNVCNVPNDWEWVIDPVDGTEELVRGRSYWGIIIGLFYKGCPVASMIDHPLLNECYIALYSKGCWLNKMRLDTTVSLRPKRVVLSLPAYENFMYQSVGNELFLQIVNKYPNFRVYRCCYGQTQILKGGLDVGCEYYVRKWDLAATELLMEESGYSYFSQSCDSINDRYIAFFGRHYDVEVLSNLYMKLINGVNE